jgi:hypothetical protein
MTYNSLLGSLLHVREVRLDLLEYAMHGLINHILKTPKQNVEILKIFLKGTLQQVFIRVYRLEKHSVMLVFDPAL